MALKYNTSNGWADDPTVWGGIRYYPDLAVQRRLCLENLFRVTSNPVYWDKLCEMWDMMDTSVPPMFVDGEEEV